MNMLHDFFTSLNEAITFDDVLIRPAYTDISSRSIPKTGARVANIDLGIPMISSPMDSITEHVMAIEMSKLGAVGIVHRFMDIDSQVQELLKIKQYELLNNIKIKTAFAVGVSEQDVERSAKLIEMGVDCLVIDVANGHSASVRSMASKIRDLSSSISIVAGSIATGDGYKYLADSGVNAVRVGIGGGSICKTRIQTGIGVPTLHSVIECSLARDSMYDKSTSIIADGGIRYPSDLVKSIVSGADAVMCGRIFAATKETPGEILESLSEHGKFEKIYAGMASKEVQERRRGGLKADTCAEGTETRIPLNGSIRDVISEFSGGLRSAMTYVGAKNIDELRQKSKFLRISRASLDESHSFGTRK